NYNFKNNYILADYKPTNKENKISHCLRGSYQFYTYIKNENLDFEFAFSDLNKNKDNDLIKLNLYYQDELINSQQLDDKDALADNKKINRGKLHLNINNLPEGVYKIELLVNDDIVTDQIIFKQSKIAFINRLWLTEGAKNIEIKTDSNVISAQTINPASLQTIKVGDKDLILAETYRQFSIVNQQDIVLIKLDKGDVILAGSGVFSFDQNNLIRPTVKKVDNNLDINVNKINYVLTKYQIPKEENNWQIAKVEFDITDAYREYHSYQLGQTNKMSFLISIPNLRAEDNINDKVVIGDVTVELSGKSLLDKIKGLSLNMVFGDRPIKEIFYEKN
ncbi:hypothetical protein KKH16_01680, partial [Patescibacteria group bacterium]|nr:hypothetical protein [Patescibacteria group bacterium]